MLFTPSHSQVTALILSASLLPFPMFSGIKFPLRFNELPRCG
jgi:hypothetical protein